METETILRNSVLKWVQMKKERKELRKKLGASEKVFRECEQTVLDHLSAHKKKSIQTSSGVIKMKHRKLRASKEERLKVFQDVCKGTKEDFEKILSCPSERTRSYLAFQQQQKKKASSE